MHMRLHSSILLSGHCQSTRSDSPSTAQPSVCKAHTQIQVDYYISEMYGNVLAGPP